MKLKLILIFAVVAVSLVLLACSPASKQASVEVSCDDFRKKQDISTEVQVATGDYITVALCSVPTAGYLWPESAQISDQAVLKQDDHEIIPPEDKNLVGGAAKTVWTFVALKEGAVTILMEHTQPWEGGDKNGWIFELTVVVK